MVRYTFPVRIPEGYQQPTSTIPESTVQETTSASATHVITSHLTFCVPFTSNQLERQNCMAGKGRVYYFTPSSRRHTLLLLENTTQLLFRCDKCSQYLFCVSMYLHSTIVRFTPKRKVFQLKFLCFCLLNHYSIWVLAHGEIS